jgi:D-alanyl-D-alanine carboxypeptidase/D-alanyl-D-alanine-endopeptidase (penicillin-binding protein 4)
MRSRLGVAGVLAAALLGYVAADAADVVPGKLTVSAQATPTASPRPTPADPARTTARPVLPGLSAGAPRPSPDGVSAAVGPLLRSPALGPRVSALVLDAATGEPLLSAEPDRLMVPASTTKLLTAAAVLTAIDPKTTLRTRVLQGSGR